MQQKTALLPMCSSMTFSLKCRFTRYICIQPYSSLLAYKIASSIIRYISRSWFFLRILSWDLSESIIYFIIFGYWILIIIRFELFFSIFWLKDLKTLFLLPARFCISRSFLILCSHFLEECIFSELFPLLHFMGFSLLSRLVNLCSLLCN